MNDKLIHNSEIDYIVWGDLSFTDSLAPDEYFSPPPDSCEDKHLLFVGYELADQGAIKMKDEGQDQGLDFLG